MKTIGIIGSRSRNTQKDYLLCEIEFLNHYQAGDQICSGGCKSGGDKFAEMIAKKYKIPIIIHYANWDLGRHAGFLRNGDIARDSDILIAVVSADRKGGTEDTIRKAQKLNKKIFIV
jgi:hypothetical protein